METTFFDLPLDLRGIIYRRSRFLKARQRIADLLGPRRPLCIPKSAIVYVELIISPTKRMIVRRSVYEKDIVFEKGAVFNSVEVVDEGGVHVALYANEETGTVTLLVGTQRRDIAHVYQSGKGHSSWLSTYWWRHDSETNMPVLMKFEHFP